MHERFGSELDIIGVTWAGSSSDYEAFIARHGLTFPTIDDTDGDLFGRLGITGQPAWAMIKPDGEARILMGSPGEAQLVEEFASLTGSS